MNILKKLVVTVICFFSFYINIFALENIVVESSELIPIFNKNTKVYNVYTNKEKISIYLELSENETNNDDLNEIPLVDGKNEIIISVIKNEEINKYYINIYKNYTITDNESDATLSSLKIKDYELDFDPQKKEYKIEINEIIDFLEIDYVTSNPNAYVKVTGNNTFSYGENLVNIKVISENKKNENEYKIIVNNLVPVSKTDSSILKDPLNINESTEKERLITKSVIIIFSLIIIVFSYIFIFKRKTNK